MHTIPAAMILRKPPWLKKPQNSKETEFKKSLKRKSVNEKSSNMNGENEKLFLQNGDLPKKDIVKKCSESFPDIQFLKQNKELVLEIITTQVAGDNFYLEINRNEPVPSSDIYLNHLEDIYNCLQNSREKWQFYQNLKLSKIRLYCDMLDVKDDGNSTYNHKSQSFQLGKCLDFDTSDLMKTSSVPDITDKKIKEFDQNSLLMKLKYIKDAQSDILSTLSQEKKTDATKVIQELQKLYNAYTILSSYEKKRSEKKQVSVLREAVSSLETIAVKEEDLRSNSFLTHIITAMKIYKKPLFLLICLCRAVHFITFVPVITAVVDFIMDKGLVEADGKYAIAALSLGDLLGRLCLGWITDRGYMSLPRYMLVIMILQGICTASLAWMNSKATLFIMLAVFGMFQGSLFVRHNVLVSKYFERHEQSIAMGCMNFFSGLLGFALPAYIGYFRDTIGSYDYIMYINGAIGIFVGLLWALEPYFQQKFQNNNYITMDINQSARKKIRNIISRMNGIRLEGPDGLWSWIVALACGAVMFIFVGFVRLSGMMFVSVLETFQVDRNTAARPFCTHYSVVSILGPIGGMLCQKYGARRISIIGGAVASTSAAVCFFAPNVAWITFLWGILNGSGVALSTIAVRVIVCQYFVKHPTSALGLASSGGCVAPFAFSLFLEMLLFNYGIHGAFLIIGAISLHTIPISMIFRKPSWLKASITFSEHQDEDVDKKVLPIQFPYETNDVNLKVAQRFGLFKTNLGKERNFPDLSFLRKHRDAVYQIFETENKTDNNFNFPSKCSLDELEDIYCLVEEYYEILLPIQSSQFLEGNNYCDKSGETSRMERFSIQEAENVASDPLLEQRSFKVIGENLPKHILMKLRYIRNNQTEVFHSFPEGIKSNIAKLLQEMNKLDSFVQKIVDINREMNGEDYSDLATKLALPVDATPTKQHEHSPNSLKGLLKTLLQLYSKPLFLILTANRVISFIGTHSLFTIIVDFAMDKGFTEGDGRHALVITTLGEVIGRLCLGWVTDNGYVSVPKYMLLVTVIRSTVTIYLPFINSYTNMLIMLTAIGVLQGSVYVQLYGIVSKYMESHEKSVATGCINLLPGLLGFGLPAYIGYFRDTIGSYYYIFYINGAFELILGLLWILSSYLPRTPFRKSC
ncbi:Monocarboxylate transporter 9 like protein [Argiope bruennichi]|uniref:Monocarboxylate transporter 9 like protein n=1 Tax=Argiope bruennichi TaxID=94029 RepID=A0A8T0E730_ARGBR|nr:Monocarboxylate transporter 9 like protein [Argiope bruennichi]